MTLRHPRSPFCIAGGKHLEESLLHPSVEKNERRKNAGELRCPSETDNYSSPHGRLERRSLSLRKVKKNIVP